MIDPNFHLLVHRIPTFDPLAFSKQVVLYVERGRCFSTKPPNRAAFLDVGGGDCSSHESVVPLLWMENTLHHFDTMGNQYLAFTGGIKSEIRVS